MLKWAVNNPNRPSQRTVPFQVDDSERQQLLRTRPFSKQDQRRLRRKSSGNEMTNIRRKILNRDKENNLTSTPLPLHRQSLSPLRRYDSLRDLSNIPPAQDTFSTPVQTPKSFLANTNGKNNPQQYASTLPTFDAEYSPCSLVPGPVLALRGMGIADSYFEKPRYLSEECQSVPAKRLKRNSIVSVPCQPQRVKFQIPQDPKMYIRPSPHKANDDESLSSSRMGDTTLDRMIDAILESARKEKRPPKLKQQTHPVMSPTYTRAEDPASDLNEIWHKVDEKDQFNEREVRTPDSLENTIQNSVKNDAKDLTVSCHLRRQRAVRRKRKHAAMNQGYVKTPTDSLFANNSLLRKSFDELVDMDTPQGYRNLSPDSGRNSASDLEESGEDNNNCTRRKLSFSPNLSLPKLKDKIG